MQTYLRYLVLVHIVDFMNKPIGVVERSAVILRAVASAGVSGARLLDVAQETGISRPTVHRILQAESPQLINTFERHTV